MASAWETLFGLNPASGGDAAGRSRRRRRQQSRRVPARQPPERHPRALPRRRRQQQLLPDPGRHRQSGHRPGDRGDCASSARTAAAGRAPSRSRRASRAASTAEGRFASSFSTVIESDQPLVADRVMTWGGGYGSHSETATAAPSTDLVPRRGRDARRLPAVLPAAEPGRDAGARDVTYLRPAPAAPITLPYTIAAESRLTIPVDAIPGLAATDVSARIVSDVADPRRAGDVHGHREPAAGLRRRPCRQRRDRGEPALVPGGRRDRRVLRHVLPDRQPLDPGDARARHLPAARTARRS